MTKNLHRTTQEHKNRRGAPTKNKYEDWIEKVQSVKKNQELILREGTDYDCDTLSICQQIWRHFRKKGITSIVLKREKSSVRLSKRSSEMPTIT